MLRTWKIGCLGLVMALLMPVVSRAESWSTFSHLIGQSDYIAQFQVHTRNGKPIGQRLVQVYWQTKGFDDAGIRKGAKPWNLQGFDDAKPDLQDFNTKTDGVRTEFEFFGRGQPLWTASEENGVILYPGTTANIGSVGTEIAGSEIEFHEILIAASKLKRSGSKIQGNLELSVFGKKQLAKSKAP